MPMFFLANLAFYGKMCIRDRVYIRSQDLFIENSGGSQDGAETGQGLGLFLEEKTYREIEKRGLKGTGDNQTALSGQTAVATTPLAYVAPGAGIALGRLLNLGGLGLLYLGRLFNLLMFTAVMWLAVKRMPFGKEILCAVGLLPKMCIRDSSSAFRLEKALHLPAALLWRLRRRE